MRRLILPAAALTAIIVIAVLLLMAVMTSKSRADKCRAGGGTVTSEVEYEKRPGTENGRKVTKKVPYTEYECIVNGQEVDEWR